MDSLIFDKEEIIGSGKSNYFVLKCIWIYMKCNLYIDIYKYMYKERQPDLVAKFIHLVTKLCQGLPYNGRGTKSGALYIYHHGGT